MNIKEHIEQLKQESPTAVATFLNGSFDSRKLEEKYFHRYSPDEVADAKTTVAEKVNDLEDWMDEVKKEKTRLDNLTKDKRDALKKLAKSVQVGGIDKVGNLYVLVDETTRRALVYDIQGNLIDERPMNMEERQRHLKLKDPLFDN